MSGLQEITFINRAPCGFVSIERVFSQVARSLRERGLETRTVTLPFGSGIVGIILNLLFFRRPSGDIFHVTGHTHFICLRLPRGRTVLTIHDLRFLEGGGRLRRWLVRKLFLEWPVARAALVTAVSERTRLDIIRETGCDARKVVHVPNPLREEFGDGAARELASPRRGILHVGTMPNKNLSRLVEALRGLDAELTVIGTLDAEQRGVLQSSGIHWRNEESLTSEGMLEAYRSADLLSFCSTFEGFGLPIIEAQATGLPVVTSDISPMREVAGEGAVFVNPLDVESIRCGISAVMQNDDIASRIVAEGKENIKRFDRGAVADAYLAVYSKLSGVEEEK